VGWFVFFPPLLLGYSACACVREDIKFGHLLEALFSLVARAPLGDDDVRVVTYRGFVLLGSIYLH
jgi:hypothetical protein